MPVQVFSEQEIKHLNALNISDVTRSFAGVNVVDYGGIGGLKTVSLRGMGAKYTGVCYDGVMLSNIQSGEVDLGRLTLESVSEVSLSNGQLNDIFQTARSFASGSVLQIKTKLLNGDENRDFDGVVSCKAGSFGFVNPVVFLEKNIGEKWSFNLSANATLADGKYNFLQYYGNTSSVSEELTRTNTDVAFVRTEMNAQYRFKPAESMTLKANFFGSERGLPGAVIFYNKVESSQRLLDRSFFSQLHYENRVSERFQHQYFAKINVEYNKFSDQNANYASSNGLLTNYLQKEIYLSSNFQYKFIFPLSVALSTDWWMNDLLIDSNIGFKQFPFPTRETAMANAALKYTDDKLTASASLLYTRATDKTNLSKMIRYKWSPTVSFSYKLLDDKELRIRAFYKNMYRLPTFNELYYQDFGNTNLHPENNSQFDLGLTFFTTEIPHVAEFAVVVDGYYIETTDKIIALPKDMFHWSVVNKDKVHSLGIDLSVNTTIEVGKSDELRLKTSYTFLSAKDATPNSETFGEQIQYTPEHSGSASVSYHHGIWEAGYNLLFSGIRWSGQTTDLRNKLDAYAVHSLFVSTQYKQWNVKAELIDVLNTQYEVIRFYPMPRRNFRITLGMNLGKQ